MPFDSCFLAQLRYQFQKQQARNILSTNFQTYSLYRNEVIKTFENEHGGPWQQKWDVALKV